MHRIDNFGLSPTGPKNGNGLFEVGTILKERLLDLGYDKFHWH
jgi:hypothetical protein